MKSLIGLTKTKKYITDKQKVHGYLSVYEDILKYLDDYEKCNILELGVWRGGSLMLWRDRFVNSTVYGIDISRHRKTPPLGERIHSLIPYSCINKEHIEECLKDLEFEVIIDDASHARRDQIMSFKLLFGKLKSGCKYIIEDVWSNLDAQRILKNIYNDEVCNSEIASSYVVDLTGNKKLGVDSRLLVIIKK